jgi:hypothetical protein
MMGLAQLEKDERILDVYIRYKEYGSYRLFGYSKRIAAKNAGISLRLVAQVEDSEVEGMLLTPSAPADPNDIPY